MTRRLTLHIIRLGRRGASPTVLAVRAGARPPWLPGAKPGRLGRRGVQAGGRLRMEEDEAAHRVMGRTARDLTPREREAYREAWARVHEARQSEAKQRAERALAVARRAADILHQDFGVSRVWLFGSLARGTFDAASDIDLAVDGIEERVFLRALGRLLSLDPEFEVDLVDLRDARPGLRTAVERDGILL